MRLIDADALIEAADDCATFGMLLEAIYDAPTIEDGGRGMSDEEWIKNLPNFTNERLIKALNYFGCDPYYADLWSEVLEEIKKRLDGGEE